MPQHSTLKEARERAAYLERADRGRIVIAGRDRAAYLHGLLTNDIAGLQAGQGVYAAYLTPQGRMISDMWVYELGDVILMSLPQQTTATVLARLDQFVFSEDVQLGDVTDRYAAVAVVGANAAAVVAALVGRSASEVAALVEHGNLRAAFAGEPAIVTRVADVGVPGYDIYVERTRFDRLVAALDELGVPPIDADLAAVLRVEAGIPRFGDDMDEDTIPLEAGIEPRAISFTKGCYVGQEVIIRVMHRGHGRVARKLVGLVLEGTDVPSSGATVLAGERDAGSVRSAVLSPTLGRPVALAYVHRDFTAPGTALTVDGRPAQVHALPFVPAAA